MSDDLIIPVIEEQAHVTKRVSDTEHVRVSTTPVSEEVVVRDAVRQQHVEVTRIPIGREVAEAPLTRTEGDTTIVPVLEERLVVEKKLFLVEEVHLRVTTRHESVEMPTTLRRTRVDVERTPLNTQEDH